MSKRSWLACLLVLVLGASAALSDTTYAAVSKQKAAQVAKQRFGGKVLKVTLNKQGEYRVKLLVNGKVKQVKVDAASGKIKP